MPAVDDGRPKPLLHLLVAKSTEPLRTACGHIVNINGGEVDFRVVVQPSFVECKACRSTVDFDDAVAAAMETVLVEHNKESS